MVTTRPWRLQVAVGRHFVRGSGASDRYAISAIEIYILSVEAKKRALRNIFVGAYIYNAIKAVEPQVIVQILRARHP